MKKVLRKQFFERNVHKVSKNLIGKFLVRRFGNREVSYMITETESYDGERDLACHASKGRTRRTEVMYGEAGRLYIYLCYGVYYMLNFVTGKIGYPAAVLIRAIEKINGPGKVTKKLHIDKRMNGLAVIKKNGLWIEDRGVVVRNNEIVRLPRVGIAYAGPLWSKKKWRFKLKQ